MSLNIKDEQTHRMVRELAALTGESMTAVVRTSVRERLEHELRERSAEAKARRILEHGRAIAARLDERTLNIDHGELLYDELGLPK